MILATWRARRANRILIEQLHGEIVASARRPALFLDFGAPDTIDGRFEMVTLHAGLAMRRLSAFSGVGMEIAQELADCVFRHFDDGLREMGVGDTAVPKRMKRLAEAFYGRNKAYGEALDEPANDRLESALARNVYGAANVAAAPLAPALARFVRACAEALDGQSLDDFAAGRVRFPDPDQVQTSAL
ncbi:MAG TPA: ubiquinol-cytochrome C chaperone family protein [Roseiarcus sp.]|nr:ubiquinol-cytochrome C chaperone family protein [Roseiarcus sp.]